MPMAPWLPRVARLAACSFVGCCRLGWHALGVLCRDVSTDAQDQGGEKPDIGGWIFVAGHVKVPEDTVRYKIYGGMYVCMYVCNVM